MGIVDVELGLTEVCHGECRVRVRVIVPPASLGRGRAVAWLLLASLPDPPHRPIFPVPALPALGK